MRRSVLDWLRVEHGIEKASLKLQSPTELDSDAFVAEVKRVRGKKHPLSAAALKSLRDEYARTIEPARAQAAEALKLERQLSDLVNEAYGLTPDEVSLLWEDRAAADAVLASLIPTDAGQQRGRPKPQANTTARRACRSQHASTRA